MIFLIRNENKEYNKEHRRIEMDEAKFYQHIDALSKEISKVFSEIEKIQSRAIYTERILNRLDRLANKKPWYRRLFK